MTTATLMPKLFFDADGDAACSCGPHYGFEVAIDKELPAGPYSNRLRFRCTACGAEYDRMMVGEAAVARIRANAEEAKSQK